MDNRVILQVRNISKRFGMTRALIGVNLDLERGGVYSLVGKNGAGKSTLVNIIAGIYKPDNGAVIFEGENITSSSLQQRQKSGIRIVTQHASVIPNMTVAENIAVGFWPRKKIGTVDWKMLREQAASALKEYGIDLNPDTLMGKVDPIIHRKINIIRALFGGGKLIILDEPTTSLSSSDRDILFDFVRELATRGITFIFISHYLDEVLKLSTADRIIVMRDGQLMSIEEGKEVDEMYLANLLAGENVVLARRDTAVSSRFEEVAISCNKLCTSVLQNVTLTIRQGEIVGLIGFPGSGAQELCRTLYGLENVNSGSICIMGKKIRTSDITEALHHNIAYIPNDRHLEGIIPIHSIKNNISLPILKKMRGKFGILNKSKEEKQATEMKKLLEIKANSVEDLLDSLSGGNQQKVVVSKAISCEPICLILDEPTIGIDIKSREEILSLINDLTKTGMCALYYTNDFDELARMCDRLIFFERGQIVRETQNNQDLKAKDIIALRDRREKKVQ